MTNMQLPLATADIQHLNEERQRLAQHRHADATRYAYARDWRNFEAWCKGRELTSLPASGDTVALYATDLLEQGARVSSVLRYTSAINFQHVQAKIDPPPRHQSYAVIVGTQRLRREQPQQKRALTVEQLRAIAERMDGSDIHTVRDKAILLFGFSTSLRQSNIVSARLADVQFISEGFVLRVGKEKQNQGGPDRLVAVPKAESGACPVAALKRWIEKRGDFAGPLFTAINWGKANDVQIGQCRVRLIVKAGVELIGLPREEYAAHSLRAGMISEALLNGVDSIRVAQFTGHKSLASLRRYFRPSDPFRGNVCGVLGL